MKYKSIFLEAYIIFAFESMASVSNPLLASHNCHMTNNNRLTDNGNGIHRASDRIEIVWAMGVGMR